MSNELSQWLQSHKSAFSGIAFDGVGMIEAWRLVIEALRREEADEGVIEEAETLHRELRQNAPHYSPDDAKALKLLARRLRSERSRDAVRKALDDAVADGEVGEELAARLAAGLPDTASDSIGGCVFCAALGSEFGPAGIAIGCAVCAIFA